MASENKPSESPPKKSTGSPPKKLSESPPKKKESVSKDSRSSFIFQPNNNRITDPIKIQKRLGEWNLFPYTFVIGSDVQFGFKALAEKITPLNSDKERVVFTKCIEKINALDPKPKFLAIVGDMCCSPPTTNNDYAMRRQQEKEFFTILDSLDSEIYFIAVCGDRDLGDPPTHTAVNRYRISYGPEYSDFEVAGVRFIFLCSSYYANNSQVASYAEDQDKWLSGKLQEEVYNAELGPIVLMHMPPFIQNPTEANSKLALPQAKREKFLKTLLDGKVKYVFSGHTQKNSSAKHASLEVITTAAIGAENGPDKPGFRVVTLHQNKLEHKYVTLD